MPADTQESKNDFLLEVMKRCTAWILIFSLSVLNTRAQVDSTASRDTGQAMMDTIAQRLVLIGDAGKLTDDGRHPVVDAVRKNVTLDKKTTVLYLGDNLYKVGLPDEEFAEYAAARAVLDSQLSIADGTDARVFMIPGNHDWHNGGRTGYDAIIRQQLYVDFLSVQKPNIAYHPTDGCPGPKEIQLGDLASIIVFDSQWWVHAHDKPEIESDCDSKTKEELVQQIEDIAARNSKKLVILACHHPFKSNGPHGGFFTLKQHIFPFTDWRPNLYIPLPVLGSIYPISRSVFGTPQDINHPVYQTMINQVTEVVRRSAANAIFVAGHEHNLQHIRDSNYHYIVSGGGCKENRASESRKSQFISPTQGFAVLEISVNKNVTLTFYTVSDSVRKAYTSLLLNFNKPSEAILDSATQRPNLDPFLKYSNNLYSISASDRFPPVSGLKKFFMGQNYRYEWSEPVEMKVFNLNREMGGFEILSLGGGKQTLSLRLRNKTNQKEYVLRSLNKNTTQAIPEQFRFSLANDLVAELTSASHPYGALVVPVLAENLQLTVARPRLFFVPEDESFGFYTDLFKNTVCMLEERHAGWDKDSFDTRSTAKVFDKLLEDNDHRAIQKKVVRARLLDMLIADFDRHFDQWRWGIIDTGKGRQYYPIPRDRDQAFFYSDGFLLKMVSSRIMPFLKGFRYDIPRPNWLGYAARDFDRIFTTELDQNAWELAINELQTNLTDSVIRKAVQQLPPEIFKIGGETMIRKLISRRNKMKTAGLKYYRFISRQVNVVGSNEKEYFKVSNHGAGLQVRVYAYPKGKDTSFVMYDRIFDPSITKEIRLFGLNDDDKFEIEENAHSRIKLRIIGGKGYDTFDIRGNVENLLYDLNTDLNYIAHESRTKNRFSLDPPNNERSILGYQYNFSKFPQFSLAFNSDDRLIGGAAFSRRTFGFRNLPYATDQRLSARWAFRRRAYHLKYKGEFNHVTRNVDVVATAEYYHPALRNFFGIGNQTKIDENRPFHFYQTRYQSFEAGVMLQRRYYDKFFIQVGPYYYRYHANYQDNRNNILGHFREMHLDSAHIFDTKQYGGAKLSLLLNNLNNELFPTRGMHWTNDLYALKGFGNARNYLAYVSDMKVYASLTEPARLVSVFKFGWGRIYSKHYEYFQAMNFGVSQSLYSFRKNRYAGRSMMYGSLELRLKMADVNSYILPGAFGILGFYDVGRVFERTLPGKKWHSGYGGGFYFIPFNLFVITATAGISEGEPVFYFTLGTRINISF